MLITKHEKFSRLMKDLVLFTSSTSLFKGVHEPLGMQMSPKQISTFQKLKNFSSKYNYRYVPFEEEKANGSWYVEPIKDAYELIISILGLLEKPVTFCDGQLMEPLEERYDYLQQPEHNGSKIGSSFFMTTPDGHVIKKHGADEFPHIYGLVLSYTADEYLFPDWLHHMGPGRYTIDGIRFDIQKAAFFWKEPWISEVSFYGSEGDQHPILLYIQKNDAYETPEEPECYSCGDGGCISCRPGWFI